jgi:hypothetical protein
MGTRIVDKDLGMKNIIGGLEILSQRALEVGVFEDAGVHPRTDGDEPLHLTMVAAINEFGSFENPRRPFLLHTFQTIGADVMWALAKAMPGQDAKPGWAIRVVNDLGKEITMTAKQIVTDWEIPPNSAATIRKYNKAGSDPLVWTGSMRDAIKHRVVVKDRER